MATCDRPPAGWHCTLDAGHDGPCPAVPNPRAAMPHCDTRILHAPSECRYCDQYDDWQELRRKWGIAFTGHEPVVHGHSAELPCPADYNRPKDSSSDHRQWPGNQRAGLVVNARGDAASTDTGWIAHVPVRHGAEKPEREPADESWLTVALRGMRKIWNGTK